MMVQELLDRYSINSRKTLYSRLNAINLQLKKDNSGKSIATPEQIEILDELDQHLKQGGTLNNFVATHNTITELHTTQPTTQCELTPYSKEVTDVTTHTTQLTTQTQLTAELLGDIIEKIKESIEPKDPLNYMNILERVAACSWVITTSEVEQLIKVKPSTKKGQNTFVRGCWCFIKCGKIGNETGWKVIKKIENVNPYRI